MSDDRMLQMRKDLQLITEAGIPCGDLDVDRDGYTVFEIAWAIREDVGKSHGQLASEIDVVCRMSLKEKAELRERVAKRTIFKDIQQRCSRVTAVRFSE